MIPKQSQHCPKMIPNMIPKWSQNGPNMIPKWSQTWPHNYPKMILKCYRNYFKMVPTWSQNDPKMIPKWSQTDPNIIRKWSQNDFKMIPKFGYCSPGDRAQKVIPGGAKTNESFWKSQNDVEKSILRFPSSLFTIDLVIERKKLSPEARKQTRASESFKMRSTNRFYVSVFFRWWSLIIFSFGISHARLFELVGVALG